MEKVLEVKNYNQNMKDKLKMEYRMVKGQSLRLMEVSMLGNTGMGIGVVKEHSLSMMEENMLGIG